MRRLLITLSFLVAVVIAFSSSSCSRGGEWTSTSEAAVREFELGLESRMKLYGSEAREHFERALELDPDFVSAKLALLRYGEDKERRKRLREELVAVDLERLNKRERFLLSYTLAKDAGELETATSILEEYFEDEPHDPYGVARLAEEAWNRQDWEKAEKAYEKLLELDPNWVTAQNHLGYMAMAQGHFEAAEERFKAYRFVAPDQANPHDSMGELLTVVGRYEEALAELEEAVAIRPDFCASYMHMLDVLVLEGRPYDGYAVLERAESDCPPAWDEGIGRARCELAFWSDYLDGDFDAPWSEEREACLEKIGSRSFLIHRIASLSGRWDEALAIEAELTKHLEGHQENQEVKALRGVIDHYVGVRLLAQGETEEAIEKMRKADSSLFYWGQDQGILKLFNRLNLAYALETVGRDEEAAKVLDDVRAVNEPFAEAYPAIREGFAS